ncbi:MAG: hypothetical protein IT272_11790 [Chitinophagales bacterium]|jgi:hypothetical protein|nr:hypothetical protein [Chitinophagales bacterium]
MNSKTHRYTLVIVNIFLLTFFTNPVIYGQSVQGQHNETLVQVSGVVMAAKTNRPLQFAVIISKKQPNNNILTNDKGFFSMVTVPGDTLLCLAYGYLTNPQPIPNYEFEHGYSLNIITMLEDTNFVRQTAKMPYPEPSDFNRAFLALETPEDDFDRALRNLDPELLAYLATILPYDGGENYNLFVKREMERQYTRGQYPSYKIFDVFAWAKFVKALKHGDIKISMPKPPNKKN